jgi:ABC-type antimicrobial peptide transport system ATPase subunit
MQALLPRLSVAQFVEADPTELVMTRPEHPYIRALAAAAFDLAAVA